MLGDDLYTCVFPDWRAEKARQVRNGCQPGSSVQVLVAELEGRVVGFCLLPRQQDTGVGGSGNNAVRPDFQGRGIAPQLYEEVFRRMKAAGMRAVRVTTGGDPAHAPARRAYEKVGFERFTPSVTLLTESYKEERLKRLV